MINLQWMLLYIVAASAAGVVLSLLVAAALADEWRGYDA